MIDINQYEIFQKNGSVPLSDHKGNQEIVEDLKLEPFNEKVGRCKSNWLRNVTRMNNNRMPKIMLNCRIDGRRRLRRPFKRLLDEAIRRIYQDLTRDK